LVPTVVTKFEEVKALLNEDCDRNSTEWLNVGIDVWGGTDYLDQFFLRPANPEDYDPASH
jgi:ribose transport system substrate-binding protein